MAHQIETGARKNSAGPETPGMLYGLPCADCRAYYASSVAECPVCHSTQRITASGVPGAIPKMRM